ncbi:efflux RND transporter periplasmic adaptor subunit [Castellaniella sp.]|uniref:efflux RND transporter periplasmic adaptor subunit n=2 Tax=Castellaniella sp. TaxID=1955812 RepID=UPI002AFDE438|nr:efflux RND transporter periplasmic adaptor subunit [Castellaniella sp.]
MRSSLFRSRRLWLMAGGLVVAMGAALLWRPTPMAPQWASSPVVRSDIEDAVVATGTLKPSRLVSVGAQASGRIESLKVGLGDEVRSGDLIAEIDSRTQTNALESAQANLENAKASREAQAATLRQYEQAFKRQRTMLAAQASAQADYEAALANLHAAQAQMRALEASIKVQETAVATAQTNLGYTRITAPIDGTVLAVVSKQGQTVNANQTTPTIVMLGALDTMTVYAEISEADVIRVKEGQEVYFTILGDAYRRYQSTLRRIEPAPESITNEDTSSTAATSGTTTSTTSTAIYYNGVFDIDNRDRGLKTYMTAEVHIVLARAKDALVIPAAALGEADEEGRYAVRVLGQDGQLQARKVEVGINNRAEAQVLSGLALGEQVVVGEAAALTQAANNRGGPGGPPPMGF